MSTGSYSDNQPGSQIRIGDTEREAGVSALGEHYASGRLTKEEYDERSAKAYAARTNADLWPLFGDLPRPQGTATRTEGRGRNRPHQRQRGHPGWWFGAWMAPVLMVVIALIVLTRLPVFLLLIVGWFWFARAGRHWSRSRHSPPPSCQAVERF